jgi:hypothetical protein
MKTLEEVMASRKVMLGRQTKDGYDGTICLRGWTGSIIVSNGGGWDHVSVSPMKRSYTPTWDDMCALKDIFFKEDEAVIQIHPPKNEYVNNMPNCLHLWRANDKEMVLPPSCFVGMREGQTYEDAIRECKEYYKEHGYEW